MSNTGRKIVLTLKEIAHPAENVVATKANTLGDPDYIAPSIDTTDCPVTYTLNCPASLLIDTTTGYKYEFSLPNSTINNPSLHHIIVSVTNGTNTYTQTFNLPFTNYFSGNFVSAGAGYTQTTTYYDSGNNVIHTC